MVRSPFDAESARRFLREQVGVRSGVDLGHPVAPDEVWPLLKCIELKDMSTAAHTWRVVLYSRALCEAAQLEPDLVERIGVAAALHDIGKIDTPDEILKKPGKLTDAEFAIIQQHPITGYDRLVAMGVDDVPTLNLVRWHHERVDGLGYPDGLDGDDIPIGPKLFSVIDTFDAMTSIRPYRREIGPKAADRALEALEEGTGTRYCPQAVAMFTQLYRAGTLDWILHYCNDECQVPEFGSQPADEPQD
jgi:HD-GYP domain-containing protein (c-di-GMP phosphodiesterase class II)